MEGHMLEDNYSLLILIVPKDSCPQSTRGSCPRGTSSHSAAPFVWKRCSHEASAYEVQKKAFTFHARHQRKWKQKYTNTLRLPNKEFFRMSEETFCPNMSRPLQCTLTYCVCNSSGKPMPSSCQCQAHDNAKLMSLPSSRHCQAHDNAKLMSLPSSCHCQAHVKRAERAAEQRFVQLNSFCVWVRSSKHINDN